MAYVPGFENDLFLSYAHGDDTAWIQAFQQSLGQAVRNRLGHDILLWQDVKQLRVGLDWASEIREGISKTAAFVAVMSPSYQNSDWCTRELTSFLGTEGSLESVKAGDLSRFLKIVKIPWENNDHEAFFPRLQHVQFFRKVDGPQEYVEYPIGSENFQACLQEAAASITAVLRTMRRRLQMLFVASPADDVVDAWTRVRTQLFDDRYNVRPEGRINSGYEDRVILREIENAVLSVHLLGPSYDAFAERQLRLAAEAGRRQMIWFAKGTESKDQVDPRQWTLMEAVRRNDGLNSGLDWFPGTVQEMIGHVQGALRPKPVEAAGESSGQRIYLIHDPTTREDAAFASELQARLQEQEKLEVIFPPSGISSVSDFQERHRQQLQNSEGVLLYWNRAPETWFDQYYADVLIQGRKAKAKSKAFLLDDPTQLDNQTVPVIQRKVNFQLSDLDPFLEPLRAGEVKRAGA